MKAHEQMLGVICSARIKTKSQTSNYNAAKSKTIHVFLRGRETKTVTKAMKYINEEVSKRKT